MHLMNSYLKGRPGSTTKTTFTGQLGTVDRRVNQAYLTDITGIGHYWKMLLAEAVPYRYTLSEAWSGVNWADLMAAQGAFGTDFYDRSTRTLWTEYKPVINIGPIGALGSHEIRPIHSAPSLGQSNLGNMFLPM